jgi:hypothetical protein
MYIKKLLGRPVAARPTIAFFLTVSESEGVFLIVSKFAGAAARRRGRWQRATDGGAGGGARRQWGCRRRVVR